MPMGIYLGIPKDYGIRICAVCKKEFIKRPKQKPFLFLRQKCCSRHCNAKLTSFLNRGKKAHNNKQVKRVCIICGKSKMVAPAFSNRHFCGRKCMGEWIKENQSGSNHWNWKGGITEKKCRDVLYDGYKEWRNSVFRRDNFKCISCGCNKSGSLEAHHIKPISLYPELILDISNGNTLCIKCHKEEHYGKKI